MSLKERRSNVQFATAGNINTTIANVSTYFNLFNISRKAVHCRFLVPDNTQKILKEICHHYWLKNDGEKWSIKNYFEILKQL